MRVFFFSLFFSFSNEPDVAGPCHRALARDIKTAIEATLALPVKFALHPSQHRALHLPCSHSFKNGQTDVFPILHRNFTSWRWPCVPSSSSVRVFFFFYAWMLSPLTIGGSNEMLTDPLECQQLPWLDADAREGL